MAPLGQQTDIGINVKSPPNHPSSGGLDGQTTRSEVSKRFHVEFFSQNDSTLSVLVRATVTSLKTSQTEGVYQIALVYLH